MAEGLNQVNDSYERACDTCPFRDECPAYQEAFGQGECFRDDWAKSLLDYLRHSILAAEEGPEKTFLFKG